MPLIEGDDEETIRRNVAELIDAGHPVDQAVAIAHEFARRHAREDASFADVPVAVETPEGAARHWTQPDGRAGVTVMRGCHYGYFPGTVGEDGEGVDVFLGPCPDASSVYVVHQMAAPDFDHYDEDKVMAGFESADDAKAAFLDHYDDPRFFGSMSEFPTGELAERLRRPGGLRADSAEPLRLWLSKRYGVDVSSTPSDEIVRRATSLVGRRATAALQRLDAWNEEDHPRAADGRFGEAGDHATTAERHADVAKAAASGTTPSARASARRAAEHAALARVAAQHFDVEKARHHAGEAERHSLAAQMKATAHQQATRDQSDHFDISTTTGHLAEKLGGLHFWNSGSYPGTEIPLRKMTGEEPIRVVGKSTGARVVSEHSWIVDRFGGLGARHVPNLRSLKPKP